MSEFKRFIVLRNCPSGAESLEGRWYARHPEMINISCPIDRVDHVGRITFGPTGRYETREDGEKAEVFEPCEPLT